MDYNQFSNAKVCHICEGKFDDSDNKVIDHDHFTGKYRGAAHRSCTSLFRMPKHIPAVMHNLAGYDAHLFIKSLHVTPGKIDCIPNNEEKFISFSKRITLGTYIDKNDGMEKDIVREIRFLESLKFMASSLESLASYLPSHALKNLAANYEGEKFNLLSRKGVFPYDWCDSLDKLNETILPDKDAFQSKLTDSHITDEDYEHAQKVWKVFDMKTFREYHDIYLQTDLLLLADVFESFREVCMKYYGLDPAWYFTAPGLAWDAMLKITKVNLEPIIDPDMMLMVEKGIRGGVSMHNLNPKQ